jgi:hypothetical protein
LEAALRQLLFAAPAVGFGIDTGTPAGRGASLWLRVALQTSSTHVSIEINMQQLRHGL